MSIGRFVATAICLLCVWTAPAAGQTQLPDYGPQITDAKAQASKALKSDIASEVSTAVADLSALTADLQDATNSLREQVRTAEETLQKDMSARNFPDFQTGGLTVDPNRSDADVLISAKSQLNDAYETALQLDPSDPDLAKKVRDLDILTQAINAANTIKGDTSTRDTLQTALTTYEDAIKELTALSTKLQSKLNDVTEGVSWKNLFQQSTAIIATVLVAMVIFGFFFSVYKFETVRANIFSGDNGLQFITLFSIIIAIIIFGLVGSLGTSELSTLLGGLSGYILGRGADKKETKAA